MMISPECFYEMYLENKSDKEIITVIRGLKNKIGYLKNVIEDPKYADENKTTPDELVQIKCNRLYLECAKKALLEAGVTYPASKQEQRVNLFQEKIKDIIKIEFEIGGFFQGWSKYDVSYNDDQVIIKKEVSIITPENQNAEQVHTLDKDEFLKELKKIYIGEWRKNYSPSRFGYMVCDGTQWSLEITYKDGECYKIEGDNDYPYNFDELTELLCIENSFTD